jgi:hypothetical protein
LVIFLVVMSLVAAACGGGDEGSTDTTVSITTDDGSGGGGGDDGGGQGPDGNTGQNGDQDGGGDGDGQDPDDDDDAAEILGNPDLDLDELPDWVADALDDLDDIVSIGECEAAGLRATAPENWVCRVLDQPVGGQDGFTMFTEGNELNITIGTPSPFGPACELLQMCDAVEPIALSDNFPDTTLLDVAGTVTISGTHASVDAELVITKASALTPDELQLIMDVLDSVETV